MSGRRIRLQSVRHCSRTGFPDSDGSIMLIHLAEMLCLLLIIENRCAFYEIAPQFLTVTGDYYIKLPRKYG